MWQRSSYGFTNWTGDITTGKATPCNSQTTVRAHKQGQRINSTITSSLEVGNAWLGTDWRTILLTISSPIDKN